MNISPDPRPVIKHSRLVIRWTIIALLVLVIYAWIYYFEPLTPIFDYWNDKVLDVITLIPAVAAAILGLRLTRHFLPSEPPHRVWFTFMLGWWAWVAGELLGFVYDYFYWYVDYPEFTLIDICWLAGYVLFGLSLYYQFRLIYLHKHGHKTALYLSYIALALLLTLGLTQLALGAGLGEGYSWWALYLAVIYPVFDLFQGAAALWLFLLFGSGYMGRPWWGLIAFTVTDAISIFFWMGGDRFLSEQAYYIVDLFAGVVYVAGYMITALAFLSVHQRIHRAMTPGEPPRP